MLELDPENYDTQRELGRIFAAKKDPLALQYYNNALRIRPGSGEILYNRGLYYQEIGQLKEAEADYATLLASDPKDPDAHHNLGYHRAALQGRLSGRHPAFHRCDPL